ncbi:MAG: ribosome biogenesis GTP-binding protein YihA/YsxC [Pseudomonadota bacterium]
MSFFPHAKFLLSANAADQFVPDQGAEVAFAGRSNAGKSSAINTIVQRKQFARVSKTPGRTQLVNFFDLMNGRRLVDLPGYGFARVSKQMRDHWQTLISDYFEQRQSLAGLFVIVDIRRGLLDFDRMMLDYAESLEIPAHVLLTKADKLKRGQAKSAQLKAARELGERADIQRFSSLSGEGKETARDALQRMLSWPAK